MKSHSIHANAAALDVPVKESLPKTEQQVTSGAKLLCLDDGNLRRTYHPGPPIRGRIYCVREIYDDGGYPGVLLVGITGPFRAGLECGFLLSRFRWVHD